MMRACAVIHELVPGQVIVQTHENEMYRISYSSILASEASKGLCAIGVEKLQQQWQLASQGVLGEISSVSFPVVYTPVELHSQRNVRDYVTKGYLVGPWCVTTTTHRRYDQASVYVVWYFDGYSLEGSILKDPEYKAFLDLGRQHSLWATLVRVLAARYGVIDLYIQYLYLRDSTQPDH